MNFRAHYDLLMDLDLFHIVIHLLTFPSFTILEFPLPVLAAKLLLHHRCHRYQWAPEPALQCNNNNPRQILPPISPCHIHLLLPRLPKSLVLTPLPLSNHSNSRQSLPNPTQLCPSPAPHLPTMHLPNNIKLPRNPNPTTSNNLNIPNRL